MALLDRLTAALGRGGSAQSFTYKCLACNEQFTTEEAHMARVSCPGCGASDVRTVASDA
jgi:Zn finger protein HypA/HybF involved in hydrogenase expression